MSNQSINLTLNKKDLLHECNRHTAHCVASAHYAALTPNWGGGGLPPSRPAWGDTPLQSWQGAPSSSLNGGTPSGWHQVSPWEGWGNPHIGKDGGTHLSGLDWIPYPLLGMNGGIPLLELDGGTPCQEGWGTPEVWTDTHLDVGSKNNNEKESD